MNETSHRSELSGPFGMFISCAIFAFFGFYYISWNPYGLSGQFLLFVAICEWTLKCAAVAFGLCGLLTLVHAVAGNLIFAIVGLLTSILFVLIAALDVLDQQHTIVAYAPFLLILFAAWNGYHSIATLRALRSLQVRSMAENPDRGR